MLALQPERVEAELKLREEENCMVTHELHLERLTKDLSTAKERETTLLEDRWVEVPLGTASEAGQMHVIVFYCLWKMLEAS